MNTRDNEIEKVASIIRVIKLCPTDSAGRCDSCEKLVRAALTAQREAGKKEAEDNKLPSEWKDGFAQVIRAQALKEAVEVARKIFRAAIMPSMLVLETEIAQALQSLTDKT